MSEILNSYLSKDLLRFTTAGSVDDGKSTLIGRLLYDSKSIYDDQIDTIKKTSEKKGEKELNLAYFTDGLKAELEQGITIDVAYRYFTTNKRKFIIADTPGHIQYTRNMVTGASTANLALILVDARKGIIEQTKRHSLIASILGISHVVVCVNKMDLVDYDFEVFEKIKNDYIEFSSKLLIKDFQFIPISALKGDNIVQKTENMPWYQGTTLLYLLENIHIANDNNLVDARFNVQTVIRPQNDAYHDYRAFVGKMMSGVLKVGDSVTIFPSGYTSKIKSLHLGENNFDEIFVPMSSNILLEDEIDISRGDMIVRTNNLPKISQDIDAIICWMDSKPLNINSKYIIKHNCNELKAIVKNIRYCFDINNLSRIENVENIKINEIGRIKLRTTKALIYDQYFNNRNTGSFILIDEATNVTVGAGMIIEKK